MRVFLTGATGVIGRRVIPLLTAAGHRVTGVARTPAKRQQLERAGAVAADVNLFDADSVHRALAGYDAVINLATHMPSSSWQMFMRALGRRTTACAATPPRIWLTPQSPAGSQSLFRSRSPRPTPTAATAG